MPLKGYSFLTNYCNRQSPVLMPYYAVVVVDVLLDVELEELVEVVVVLELVLVLVVLVKSSPSCEYPSFFPNPPISSNDTFSATLTSLSFCRNLLVFTCIPPDMSVIGNVCSVASAIANPYSILFRNRMTWNGSHNGLS